MLLDAHLLNFNINRTIEMTVSHKYIGAMAGTIDVLLLQGFTGDFDLITKVALFIFSGTLVAVLTSRLMLLLNKVIDMPDKVIWLSILDKVNKIDPELSRKVEELTARVDEHLLREQIKAENAALTSTRRDSDKKING